MKLTEIRIENFRTFSDQTIYLDDYTCFVGPNGSGKSAVLNALNVFFRNNASTATDVWDLAKEDFHHRNIKKPVKITLTFKDLSEDAQQVLGHYYRQGRLIVVAKATWNAESECAEVLQHGSRLVMIAFAPFFEAVDESAKVQQLKDIYRGIREKLPALPDESTKPRMTNALRNYEEEHPEKCQLIEDTAHFYGWTKGLNLLAKYVQWVYVPAVKDASSEQDEGTKTALGQLLQRTIRANVSFDEELAKLKSDMATRYTGIIKAEEAVLRDVQESIEQRLRNWTTPRAKLNLNWHYDPNGSIVIKDPAARIAIGEDNFIGEVARLGHGMQRAFLISILQELASSDKENAPKLLLGIEEPELYQHPPQAQHMATMFDGMTTDKSSNTQIIVTTHSPYFVSGKGFESVRVFRRRTKDTHTTVSGATLEEVEKRISRALGDKPRSPSALMAKIEQIMQPTQRELFFTPLAVLVEGIEDLALISTHLHLAGQWSLFRSLGCHFVLTGGKCNMSRPLAIALELGIETFVVFDADADKSDGKNQKDNSCILQLCSISYPIPSPTEILWAENLVMWPETMKQAVVKELGADAWAQATTTARREGLQLADGEKISSKNQMLIAHTLECLWTVPKRSNLLDQLCNGILTHAQATQK